MASETVDAVLADMLGESTLFLHEITDYHTRLAAAHAAEVAERDARIAELDSECRQHLLRALENGQAALAAEARAEADERDARELRGLLREARDYVQIAANEEAAMNECKVEAAHRTSEARFLASIDRVIATTEQAAGGLVRDGG